MKMKNGRVILHDATMFTPNFDFIDYIDPDLNKISIPTKLVIRLYEGLRHKLVRDGVDFDQFCDVIFSLKQENQFMEDLIYFLLICIGAIFLIVVFANGIDAMGKRDDLINRAIQNKLGQYYIINNKQVFKFNVEMVGEVK